jgi:two-component system sensor histidine kinase DesK
MRLIPRNTDLGWTPYAWLIYLVFFWFGPIFSSRTTAEDWWLTALGTTVFLPLYFWGYWLPYKKALIPAALIALLGIVYGPVNFGASVFFVYASGFLGYTGSAAFAFRLLLILAALPPLTAWVFDLPPWYWIPGTVFSLLIGGINIHYAGVRRSQAALRRSQDEVERLAKLAERERIARDLHDLLGHTLTVITRKAELARKLSSRDPQRAAIEIAAVEQVAREALAEVRSAVTGFRRTDFATELAQARVTLQSALIHFESEVDDLALDAATEQVLALALREATTNVLRHSEANTCRVELEDRRDAVQLTVRDNGRGATDLVGMGLAGMRERVTSLGGSVEIDGSSGTELVVTLPLLKVSSAATAGSRESARPGLEKAILETDPEPTRGV